MKKKIEYYILILLILPSVFFGCSKNTPEQEEHHHEAHAITLWTDSTELFMEYPPLVAGKEAAFAIHLSKMKDFKAITEGMLELVFINTSSGQETKFVSNAPSHPGIFRPLITLSEPGVYRLQMKLSGSQVSDILHIENITVYKTDSEIPHEEAAVSGEEEISFLKEQQWKIDFRTEPVTARKLRGSVGALGEFAPQMQMYADVPTPVSGIILTEKNNVIPPLGTWVKKGTVLALISPPIGADLGFIRIRNEYLLAKADYERALRLIDKKAISEKKLQQITLEYEARKASYDIMSKQFASIPDARFGENGAEISLIAPIDGYVEGIHFTLGDNVTAGQKLFSISNPSKILLKVNVPVAKVNLLEGAKDASFKIEGYKEEYYVSRLNGRLLSIGSRVDELSRTVPVYFELANPGNTFKAGMFVNAEIKVGGETEVLAIPNSAVFEENGTLVTYVHLEGETFTKRALKTGIKDKEYIEVLEGVKPGERVVTAGGYQIKLASLSTAVPSGHGHEH